MSTIGMSTIINRMLRLTNALEETLIAANRSDGQLGMFLPGQETTGDRICDLRDDLLEDLERSIEHESQVEGTNK